MSKSLHAKYDAAERFERKAARKPRPKVRRQRTRRQIIAAAIKEA